MFDTPHIFQYERNELESDFFEKINGTTLLSDEVGDLQILSNKEQTNHHAIDQTCITFVMHT